MKRRDFLTNTLGVGFALAVRPTAAQTPVVTPSTGLTARWVDIPSQDGNLRVYQARPSASKNPHLILVISEIFGVHEYIQDVCRRLAQLGYCAMAPELFTRQGDPKTLESVSAILERITSKTPDQQVMQDLDATVAWAKGQDIDTEHLGITGFCWGGRITWLYSAHNKQLKAAVPWYGRLVGNQTPITPKHPMEMVGDLQAPLLGLYGGLDTGIPLETIEEMETRLKESKNPVAQKSSIYLYDNAPHAFHADYRPSYRKEDAEDGWKRMLAWFREHGV